MGHTDQAERLRGETMRHVRHVHGRQVHGRALGGAGRGTARMWVREREWGPGRGAAVCV